jgi:glycosyltransferase involved in cell wall biosynthesis
MTFIEWIGYFNETGYGQSSFDLINAISKTGLFDIRLHSLSGSLSRRFLSKKSYDKMVLFQKKPINRNSIQIYNCIPPMFSRNPRGDKAIGFAIFETFEPPPSWITSLNSMDAVICPSYFNYKIFAHAGVKRPIFHIPHCINEDVWNNQVKPLGKKDERFTFLFMGTWRKRKGWPQLIEAFLREFDEKEKVRLLIKTDKTQLANQDIEKIKRNIGLKKDYPCISFEDKVFDDESLPSFYKTVDCLVMPTLGEGFGLPPMQCMSVGVPVIVTNHSGCQDYANSQNCTLLEPSGFLIHENMDQITQFYNKKWPRIEIDTIRKSMRDVFLNQEE